jgi:hypothetical protein
MAQNNLHITTKNSSEWLASCGFILPTSILELERFNQLHGDVESSITGIEVDPFRIIQRTAGVQKETSLIIPAEELEQYRLVAKKLNDLPQHIASRLKNRSSDKPD